VADARLSPKSVARDMFEKSMTFVEYVGHYQLAQLVRELSVVLEVSGQQWANHLHAKHGDALSEVLGTELCAVFDDAIHRFSPARSG
jgi:hypothetical protein